jgi:alanine racemase
MAPGAALCAVVKADGYGHGAVPVARAAQAGGATWLAVASAGEASALRAGGVEGRLLVLGALCEAELDEALAVDADVVAWSTDFLWQLGDRPARVHVKLDTGMGRLGSRDPERALELAAAVARSERLQLAGAMTHFATADEPGSPFLAEQLERFAAWARQVRAAHPTVVAHAANSAATIAEPRSHFDLVRTGIAIYGLDPFARGDLAAELEPALSLRSYVAAVKPCAAGESVGYGRTFLAAEPTTIATVPIGYGDGYSRALSNRAEVEIGGVRQPVAGTVSMDNLTVDLGPEPGAAVGDEVTLIGPGLRAEELARWGGTINYEVATRIASRVLRTYHRDGVAVAADA